MVLESVPDGVYMRTVRKEELWFKWDETKKAFKKSQKPEDVKYISGFALG